MNGLASLDDVRKLETTVAVHEERLDTHDKRIDEAERFNRKMLLLVGFLAGGGSLAGTLIPKLFGG